ncbi:MAG TPA: glycosyltransferase family 4 protein [Ardenticatenaceae bacterium]
MKILSLTPQLPYPPRQGAALRNWGLIHELSSRHEVHLLSFGEGERPPGLASLTTLPEPERGRTKRLRTLFTSDEPDMAHRLHSRAFAAKLADLLATHAFDVVQVEGLEMVPYALPYLGKADGPLWVYDAHNAEAELQRSALLADLRLPKRWHAAAYSAVQVRRLRRYEAAHLPHFGLVVSVSDEDARLLEAASGVRPLIIPNGIDTETFTPGAATPAPKLAERPGPALVFMGKMDFRPNVDGVLWFVDEILPRISHDAPSPTLWVVGQQPHASLARLREHPQVVLTGWVDRIEPYIAGADVVVVPLRMGSGTRLKVLQALSMERPVVGTTLGCAGLGLRDGEHLRLADDPADFAAAIGDVLRDPARVAERGRAARCHVQAHFDWRVLAPQLEAAYAEARKGRLS